MSPPLEAVEEGLFEDVATLHLECSAAASSRLELGRLREREEEEWSPLQVALFAEMEIQMFASCSHTVWLRLHRLDFCPVYVVQSLDYSKTSPKSREWHDVSLARTNAGIHGLAT